MCQDESLSFNAVIIFEVMKQLMNLTYIDKKVINKETYTVLYRNMILQQIPHLAISTRTLTRVMNELKDAGFIKSDDNNMTPAYAFTPKADKYLSSIVSDILNTNGGEMIVGQKKKKPLYALAKPTTAENLKSEYFKQLKIGCMDMCRVRGVPASEFDAFIEHHSSKGKKFTNWLSAFGTWCRNYKKFNSNDGKNPNGLLG